jgi:hypothetical protein
MTCMLLCQVHGEAKITGAGSCTVLAGIRNKWYAIVAGINNSYVAWQVECSTWQPGCALDISCKCLHVCSMQVGP